MNGSNGLVCLKEDRIAGFIWWNTPSHKDLEQERKGGVLKKFVEMNFPFCLIVWEREVVTNPDYKSKGIATEMRRRFLAEIDDGHSFVVLTRMRNDNAGIIRVAGKMGFVSSGICVPSSQEQNAYHTYWYFVRK